MVLSWNSWNCPLTKRSTRLDFPTADSPKSTSLNWQILLPAFGPLGRVAPPLPAMSHYPVCRLLAIYWKGRQNKQKETKKLPKQEKENNTKVIFAYLCMCPPACSLAKVVFCRWRRTFGRNIRCDWFQSSCWVSRNVTARNTVFPGETAVGCFQKLPKQV